MNEWNFSSGRLQCTAWCDAIVDGCIVIIFSLILSMVFVKKVIKSLLLCCLENSGLEALFFVSLAPDSNKYVGVFCCCCFLYFLIWGTVFIWWYLGERASMWWDLSDLSDVRQQADGQFSQSVCFLTWAPINVWAVRLYKRFTPHPQIYFPLPQMCHSCLLHQTNLSSSSLHFPESLMSSHVNSHPHYTPVHRHHHPCHLSSPHYCSVVSVFSSF